MNSFVSIILVSYNSGNDIPGCLDSLRQQTYKNFKIILVDNNSSDNSIKVAEKYKEVEIIKNKNNEGFAGGNNIGIKEAFNNQETKYVVLLNLDMVADKNWLTELIKVAEKQKNIGSVQSKILLFNKKNKINTTGNIINFLGISYCGSYLQDTSTETKIKEITYSSGASVLYDKKALKDVGLFDEDLFMYHEDLDLGWRLKLRGYKNILVPQSVTFHKYTFSKNKNKFYYLERNRLISLIKNYETKSLILFAPAGIIFEIGMIFYSIFAGFFPKKIKSYWDFIISLPKNLDKRRKIQKTRKIKDKEIIKLFDSEVHFEEIENPLVKYILNPFLKIYFKGVRKLI
jgi:GT2 family glycosyltransferase